MTSANVIEAQLLRWGESPTGRTVTFLLPDEPGSTHPFKGLKTGPSYGQRMAVSIALIDDDETTKELEKPEAENRRSWPDLTPAQQAGIRCNEESFWRFVGERYANDPDAVHGADNAADLVRRACGVTSRKDITPGSAAADQWRKIDADYQFWMQNP